MIRERINLKLVFGAVQGLISFSAIVLAFVLKFNIFDAQSSLNILPETLNFDVTILLWGGIIFLIAALFLIYDWWKSQ